MKTLSSLHLRAMGPIPIRIIINLLLMVEKKKKHGNNYKLFQSLRKQQDKFNSDFSDFQQFILPINLRPNENVTITLVYEDLLIRRFDRFTHTLSVNPGSIVEDFQLTLTIQENRPLVNLSVTAPGYWGLELILGGIQE
ncbi:unnamed protein product [Lepeophtheirus salmonis]|uniref:(salmon louse) hypothetical protein n=1 Tax=Lepeophtheirus salmonis TaxID=72036 RepID=A0A7R8CGN5_LEPSM|nr:unnamed protein product [Lepeophtheirus salmonis]CAF2812463.1 unnamed protein product [Lepeophtheirus salmonis]